MKRIILIFSLLTLVSCKKEVENCNCGTIANDGIEINSDGSLCHWLEIRNACTDNKKTFCFDEDIWMDANPGENFCVTNETGW
jgi:hypothetical protein